MTLPLPSFAVPPEDYAPRSPPTGCDPHPDPKPGVVLFRDFVVEQVGGGAGSITRPCEQGSASHHEEGRAWDWAVRADNPVDAAAVETLLSWLMAPDAEGRPHAMLRRAGIDYVIWDRQIWNARDRVWSAYDGYDDAGDCPSPPCRHAHRDHVHVSFGWPGANAATSFYDWLGHGPAEPFPTPEPVPVYRPAPDAPLSVGGLAWGAVGLGLGYFAMRTAQRLSTGVGSRRPARSS